MIIVPKHEGKGHSKRFSQDHAAVDPRVAVIGAFSVGDDGVSIVDQGPRARIASLKEEIQRAYKQRGK